MGNILLARIDGKNCIMDSELAAELVKLSPYPLENCSNCGVVKRKDTWCTCDAAEKASTEVNGLVGTEPLANTDVAEKPKRDSPG